MIELIGHGGIWSAGKTMQIISLPGNHQQDSEAVNGLTSISSLSLRWLDGSGCWEFVQFLLLNHLFEI